MTKAEQVAASLDAAQLSVLQRMEAGYSITPGAWTFAEYEFVESSPKLFKPMYAGRDKGFGHTLTAFGLRVQRAASGTEARRAETPKDGSVHDGPVAKPDAQNKSEDSPNVGR